MTPAASCRSCSRRARVPAAGRRADPAVRTGPGHGRPAPRQRRGRRHGRRQRRRRVLQLHRLRAQRAAAVAAGAVGRLAAGRGGWRSSASCAREDLDRPQAYAAYVRVRPWLDRGFDIQAGRIPPSFGVFSRRAYATDNPVIGYPLAYQYLTSIHPDAVPATRRRSAPHAGARLAFELPGRRSPTPAPGVPLVTAFRWDTGVQAHWQAGIVDATGAVTAGTLSDPHADDNNGSPQVSGRVALRAGDRPDPRRVGGARRVAVERRDAAAAGASRRAASRRRPGARTPSTRAITGWCAASWSGAAGACRSRPPRRPASTSMRWRSGSKDATS